MTRRLASITALVALALVGTAAQQQQPSAPQGQQDSQVFRFRTGVELINVKTDKTH